jgi:hypothetical protein
MDGRKPFRGLRRRFPHPHLYQWQSHGIFVFCSAKGNGKPQSILEEKGGIYFLPDQYITPSTLVAFLGAGNSGHLGRWPELHEKMLCRVTSTF